MRIGRRWLHRGSASAHRPDTAGHLAKLSDRVASELDSGDTCHAAHTADDLRAAVENADIPASMQAGVDEVTGRLVDEVNCPPPPPPPEPKKKKPDDHKDQHGDENHGASTRRPGKKNTVASSRPATRS